MAVHSEISTGLVQKPKPQPKLAPSPEDNRPSAKPSFTSPTAPKPSGPPVPILQQYGFHGSVADFNQRVDHATQVYHARFGYRPSPGLVFDLVRAPLDDLGLLFDGLPSSERAAQAKQHLPPEDPANKLVPHPAGGLDHPGIERALSPWLPQREAGIGLEPGPAPPEKLQALQKKYPMVSMGILPVPNGLPGLDAFYASIKRASQQVADNLTSQPPPFDKARNAAEDSYQSLTGAAQATSGEMSQRVADIGRHRAAVQTVGAAQEYLRKIAPEYFSDLPADGTINQTWATRIVNYKKSNLGFQQSLQFLSQSEGFGNNTGRYVNAWKYKQASIRKLPQLAHVVNALPLKWFADHGSTEAGIRAITGTHGWGYANLPTVALHSLANSVVLGLDIIGGTVNQATADLTYANAFMQAIGPKALGLGEGKSFDEARAEAARDMAKRPSLVRAIVNPNMKEHDWLSFADFGLMLALGKPGLTGERVAAGSVEAARASRYFHGMTGASYGFLRKGNLGEASKMLENGHGAEALNAYAEPKIAAGEMGLHDYRTLAAQLFAKGHVITSEGDIITGPMLRSLREQSTIPTPSLSGQGNRILRAQVRAHLDSFDEALRGYGYKGTDNAASFVSSVRQLFARRALNQRAQHIFSERLPEDVYNWAAKNLKDRGEAQSLRDDLIRARAKQNIPAIQDVFERMQKLYKDKYPLEKGNIAAPPAFEPLLETESYVNSYFPGGRRRAATAPGNAIEMAVGINEGLNRFAAKIRQLVVGGSPVPFVPIPPFGAILGEKHLVADLGRFAGGVKGTPFVKTAAMKDAQAEILQQLEQRPSALRDLGVARKRTQLGEQDWMLRRTKVDQESFNTGALTDSHHMEAAGAYLRNHLTDPALSAFRKSSETNLGPLIDLVEKNPRYRAAAFKKFEQGIIPRERGASFDVERETAPLGNPLHDYAEALYTRYKEINDSFERKGVTLEEAAAVARQWKNIGAKSDKALGNWIAKKELDFPVRSGLVAQGTWDDLTQRWIKTLMAPNKFYRKSMFDHVLLRQYADLKAAGLEGEHALPIAIDLAERQTIYHMLDFSNMLQAEQNLRWLAMFFTKHRLYWQWVGRYFLRHPLHAALVQKVQQGLDPQGNVNFTIHGHKVYIPAARLTWTNALDLPDTSPFVEVPFGIAKNLGKGTGAIGAGFQEAQSSGGNIFTRDDQSWYLAAKLVGMKLHAIKADPATVIAGEPPFIQKALERRMNLYVLGYYHEHNSYPSPDEIAKHALLGELANRTWKTNTALPFVFHEPSLNSEQQKLLDEYTKIKSYTKARKFLDQHPEVGDIFGLSGDPERKIHLDQMWAKFKAVQSQLHKRHDSILQQVLADGQWTPGSSAQMHETSQWYQAQLDALKVLDAQTWKGGKVAGNGEVTVPGPWWNALQGDPVAAKAFLHQAFPKITKAELEAHTIGQTVLDKQKELAALNGPAYAQLKKTQPDAWRTVRNELLNEIALFRGYPSDAAVKLQNHYYSKYVQPYRKQRDKMRLLANSTPSANQALVDQQFRAWRDSHDHPVKIDFQGHTISFPSPVRIGWAAMPAQQRKQALRSLAGKSYAGIASYEKEMIWGKKLPASVSEGWTALLEILGSLGGKNKYPGVKPLPVGQTVSSKYRDEIAKAIGREYPGFTQDYLYSKRPKFQRLQTSKLVLGSQYKSEWSDLFATAQAFQHSWHAAGASGRTVSQGWQREMVPELQTWINQQPKGFREELTSYGRNFLNTLVSSG